MSDSNNSGSFIPTNFIWDVSQIYSTDINSDAFKDLLVKLYQNINLMAMNINIKDSAFYDTNEFVNGQTFYSDPNTNSSSNKSSSRRQVFRKVVNFGSLPDTSLKSVAHDITVTTAYTFTRIYGTSSDTSNRVYIPVPNSDISLTVDFTNVNITTSSNLTSFGTTYVVLEYIKQ